MNTSTSPTRGLRQATSRAAPKEPTLGRDPRSPHSFARRVLVAVSGLSPQIVTETIYALAHTQSPAWIPTEVHLLTTTEGAHRARLSLLSETMGWFHRLCAEYGLPPIAFDAGHICQLGNAQGQPMDDIRTVADNSAAADAITAKVRELSADPDCALHVSIAGGRKSMGFYAGYALSLYGRPQDRLSHVLVSEPYENTLDFFYPTRLSHVLQTKDGRYADTKDAQVTLANIPFVSLRHGLPNALLQGNATFNETVDAACLAIAPPQLHIHLRERIIVAGGKKIKLSASGISMLALFARRRQENLEPVCAPSKYVGDLEWAHWYLREHQIAHQGDWASSTLTKTAFFGTEDVKRKDPGMDGTWFSTTLTRLHKELRKHLGPAAIHYSISDGASRPRRYQLALAADAIRFVD